MPAASWLLIAVRSAAGAAAGRLAALLRGGEVYTDDRAPVEWLVDASIFKAAEQGGR